jgi:hypothetical protein
MSARCTACHREIAWLRDRGRGLHARVRQPCEKCHPDHGGEDFRLVEWEEGAPRRFDHARAGFPLAGRHARIECRECHKPELRRGEAARLARREDPAASWIGLERECASCHDDPHRNRLGADCAKCHDEERWSPAPGFRHDRSAFPLTGAHEKVECAACHRAPGERPAPGARLVLETALRHDECSSCHRDVHAGRFGPACSKCHTAAGFRRVDGSRFDHDLTRYPLRGRHAAVECARCHVPGTRAEKLPKFALCADCHRDPHAGRATLAGAVVDCAECHTVQGFRPSRYTVARHRESAYPLEGAHATAECGDCHARRKDDATLGAAGVDLRPRYGGCVDCHFDPHAGRFTPAQGPEGDAKAALPRAHWTKSTGCSDCHGLAGFRPSAVDVAFHDRFSFALTGAHRAVPCLSCHAELQAPPPHRTLRAAAAAARSLRFSESRTRCADCHEDPHRGQFAGRRDRGACDGCHTTDSFVLAANFDHSRESSFRLDGAHRRVACAACHRPSRDERGRVDTVYRPLSGRCESCHAGGPKEEIR